MSEIDYEAEFRKLTSAIADPEISISLVEVSEFVELLNEVGMHVSRFITMGLALCEDCFEIPDSLVTLIPHLTSGLVELNEIFHDIVCEEDEEYSGDEES